mgnify:CR=1 FL=1
MSQIREAAGLTWRFVGDAWESDDPRGRFQVLEYQPGLWTALWFPQQTTCGCGKGAEGEAGAWQGWKLLARPGPQVGRDE